MIRKYSDILNEDNSQHGHMSSANELKFSKLFKDGKIPTANLNKLAIELSKREYGNESIDITQIKEVIGHLGDLWREKKFEDVMSDVYAIIDRAG